MSDDPNRNTMPTRELATTGGDIHDVRFDFNRAPAEGWRCPRCGSVYAPQVYECRRCNEAPRSGSGGLPPSDDLTGGGRWP